MATFTYLALDASGSPVSGSTQATSLGAARRALLDQQLEPLTVKEKRSLLKMEVGSQRVPRKDLMHFSRQLAVFLRAGIPIIEALRVIGEEVSHKRFRAIIDDICLALESGDTFAHAASAHPKAFPPYYVGILASAELTGNLDNVLEQLAEYLERDIDARSRVTAALVYPGVVFAMSIVTVIVLTAFVLPRFEVFFAAMDAKLPLPTRMLLAIGQFLSKSWYLLAGSILVLGGLAAAGWKRPSVRARIDAAYLKLPLIGDLLSHAILERICRILASMISAGVTLPEAMSVTSSATNNAVYRRALITIRAEMLEGRGLSEPLANTGLFPSAVRQIFRVGEETGTLDEQLATAASYYDRQLDYKIKRFTSLFEPAVLIGVGGIVGFVAIALVSAMYGIYRQVKT